MFFGIPFHDTIKFRKPDQDFILDELSCHHPDGYVKRIITFPSSSDVDLLVVSDALGFMELQALLQTSESTLRCPINTTLYTFDEFNEKRNSSFLKRVLGQQTLSIKDWG